MAGINSRDLAVRIVVRGAILIGAAFAIYLALSTLDNAAHARQPTPADSDRVPSVARQPGTATQVKVPAVKAPTVKVPAVKVPAVNVPAVRVPAVKVPAVKVPTVEVPAVEVPAVEVLAVQLPAVQLPGVQLPDVEVPDVQLPGVQLPGVEVPDVQLPGVEVPAPVAPPVVKPGSNRGALPVVPLEPEPEPSTLPDVPDETDAGPSVNAGTTTTPVPAAVGVPPIVVSVHAGDAWLDASQGRGTTTKSGVKPGVKSGDRAGGSVPTPTAPPGLPGRLPHADVLAGASGGVGHSAPAWAVAHPGWRAEVLQLGFGAHHPEFGSGRNPDRPSPSG